MVNQRKKNIRLMRFIRRLILMKWQNTIRCRVSRNIEDVCSLPRNYRKYWKRGSVFFIDELNARLHPLLVRNFLLTFLNPNINVNHAQLVFTTHDTWQLQISCCVVTKSWFVEKDDPVFQHYTPLQILWMRMGAYSQGRKL